MSITWRLRKWAEDNRTRLYMGGLDPYEVGTIADEIDATHKQLNDKAHADGERSAMKQVRSKSVDYRKGYEQAMKDMEERTRTEQNGVGITDELREWAVNHRAELNMGQLRSAMIDEIADRIDAEHESACAEAYGNGVMSVPIALDESAWVKLPVDADGVPINIGDKLDGYGQMHRVCQLRLYTDGSWSLLDEHGDVYYDMAGFAHVQPDSWETIIQDAVKLGYADYPTTDYEAELVERCRRLAGETE